MASAAQIVANRANAQKSTGPRTAEGKAVASQNAVTHGFLARETVIQGEDAGEFTFYRDRKLRDLAPVGAEETEVAERIVDLAWRLRRAERLQTEAFDTLYEKMAMESPAGGTPAEGVPETAAGAVGGVGSGADRLLGRMLVEDFSNARVLERLLLYERRIENSLYRGMRELREQKQMRLIGAPAEPISRMAERAFGGTGILPVVRNHGRDAHATITPDGATTNLSPAQGSLFKTNPISEEVSRVKCHVSSARGQAVSAPGLPTANFPREAAAQPRLCKTNPICAGTDATAVFEGEKDGGASPQEDSEETKPISWGEPALLPAARRVA